MPRTKRSRAVSKQKGSTSSRTTKLSSITEDELEDPCYGTKLNICLEEFELKFAFKLKQYDKLLEDKLAILNRVKERLKIKYSTASMSETYSVIKLEHMPAVETAMPTITPKIAVNGPISMVRLPRQGEMALSLSGSPLMITAMSHESKPNMNIPLNAQQVLSVVPHKHLDPNCLPELEEEAVEELEALEKNLVAFINLTSSNSVY